MTENKNKVEVEIFGEEYAIKANLSANYMKKLAEYVDTKMLEIAETNQHQGVHKIAILTAINLTDEIFNLQRELNHAKAKLEQRENEDETTKEKKDEMKR